MYAELLCVFCVPNYVMYSYVPNYVETCVNEALLCRIMANMCEC